MSILPVALVQMAFLVPQLEEGCAALNRAYGWGPFLGGTEGVLADHTYRGQPADPIRIRGIFVQTGDINVEVIEVVSDAPSAFYEMLRADGLPVLHHCATFAADYEGTRDHFIAQGYPVVSEFGFAGRKICYVDTRPLLGYMTEIYPELPIIRAMYAEARAAATARPGPVRRISRPSPPSTNRAIDLTLRRLSSRHDRRRTPAHHDQGGEL